MTDASEPNWNLLPHEPERFFGLPDTFDRKELKRSYNSLIRQFKPESHPAEFQRIRAAYEQLDLQLRYGAAGSSPGFSRGPLTFDWSQPTASNAEQAESSPAEPLSVPDDLAADASETSGDHFSPPPINRASAASALDRLRERLQVEPPEQILRELKGEPRKTPFDFFTLALLADTCDLKDSPTFWEWLVLGLKQHPNDPGLTCLLSEFLRSTLSPEELPKILLAVAQAIPKDHFFRLTEPLWDALLQSHRFDQVANLLADCEQTIRDHAHHCKLTFYVHFLRQAILVADDQWVTTTFAMLEENALDLDNSLNHDIELLSLLKKYRDERSQFVNGSIGREMIDQAIRDYCQKSDVEADHAILDCQLSMATESAWLNQAFPATDCDFPAWWNLWKWISADVVERCGSSNSSVAQDEYLPQLKITLQRCMQDVSGSWIGWGWDYLKETCWGITFARIMLVSVLAILPVVLWTFLLNRDSNRAQQIVWDTMIVGLVVAIPVISLILFSDKKGGQKLRYKQASILARWSYNRHWRRLLNNICGSRISRINS